MFSLDFLQMPRVQKGAHFLFLHVCLKDLAPIIIKVLSLFLRTEPWAIHTWFLTNMVTKWTHFRDILFYYWHLIFLQCPFNTSNRISPLRHYWHFGPDHWSRGCPTWPRAFIRAPGIYLSEDSSTAGCDNQKCPRTHCQMVPRSPPPHPSWELFQPFCGWILALTKGTPQWRMDCSFSFFLW